MNVSLALWLIPKLEAPGAALAALVGGLVGAYVTSLAFARLRPCGNAQTKAFLVLFRLPSFIRMVRGVK